MQPLTPLAALMALHERRQMLRDGRQLRVPGLEDLKGTQRATIRTQPLTRHHSAVAHHTHTNLREAVRRTGAQGWQGGTRRTCALNVCRGL
jgi:hypothetical protein